MVWLQIIIQNNDQYKTQRSPRALQKPLVCKNWKPKSKPHTKNGQGSCWALLSYDKMNENVN